MRTVLAAATDSRLGPTFVTAAFATQAPPGPRKL
jgi:hypothetical protein